jgi:hypothetical protein
LPSDLGSTNELEIMLIPIVRSFHHSTNNGLAKSSQSLVAGRTLSRNLEWRATGRAESVIGNQLDQVRDLHDKPHIVA